MADSIRPHSADGIPSPSALASASPSSPGCEAVLQDSACIPVEITTLPEFDDHAVVALAHDAAGALTSVIAIHREQASTPCFGATRLWHYASDIDGVRDALRLSRLMSYKAALAGLGCGGAKGVILIPRGLAATGADFERTRTHLIDAYAERLNAFAGRFITGTDVGLRQSDLAAMRQRSAHVVGLRGDSTACTAIGVLAALRAALEERFGSPDLAGRSFAIQGLGKVGGALLALLHGQVVPRGAILVADIDPEKVAQAQQAYPGVVAVPVDQIDTQAVDVFCPCALSGSINDENVDRIAASIVVGCANNQLADAACGDRLHARGILYAPDYVVNAGGLIAVFDEYRHPLYDRERVQRAVLGIGDTVRRLIDASRATGTPPFRVANAWAEQSFNRPSAAAENAPHENR